MIKELLDLLKKYTRTKSQRTKFFFGLLGLIGTLVLFMVAGIYAFILIGLILLTGGCFYAIEVTVNWIHNGDDE